MCFFVKNNKCYYIILISLVFIFIFTFVLEKLFLLINYTNMKKILLITGLLVLCGLNGVFSQTFQRLYNFDPTMSMALAWSVDQTSDGGYIMTGFQNALPPIRTEMIKTDASGIVQWSKSFGVKISQYLPTENPLVVQSPFSVKQTSDGGYIVCGQMDSKSYLMKINSTGTTVTWIKTFADNSCGTMVKQLTDGSYVFTGYINDDTKNDSASIYLAKVTSAGALSWDKKIKISSVDDDYGNSVEIISDGFVVTGSTTQIFGNDTTTDVVLLKTDLNGNHLWTKTFGNDTYSEEGNDVKKLTDGSLVITGYTEDDFFIIKTNSTGTLTWASAYNIGTADIGQRIEVTPTGLAVMGSTISIFSMTFLDMFLMKTNATGTPLLTEVYSQSIAHNYMGDAQMTSDNGFVLTGWGQDLMMGMGFLLIKTDANGISGCNENPATPVQIVYDPTPASVTPTLTAMGSSATVYGYIATPTIIPQDLCNPTTPLVVNAGNNQAMCVGQTVTIGGSPTASGGVSPYTYSWTPTTYLNSATAANPTFTPTAAGTYTLTVTVNDNGGNSGNDNVVITVNAVVTPTFTPLGPYCVGATPGNLQGTSLNGITGTWNPATISTATAGTATYTFTPTAGLCATSTTMSVTTNSVLPVDIDILASPSGVTCSGTTVVFSSTATNPGTSPVYEWFRNGIVVGNSSTYSSASLVTGDKIVCRLTSNSACATNNPAISDTITMTVTPSVTADVSIQAFDNPACTHTLVTFTATPVNGGSAPVYQWYLNGNPVGTNSSTYSNITLVSGNTIYCRLTSNQTCVINSVVYSDTIIMTVSPIPLTEAGPTVIYYGTPVQIGDVNNGPGDISWVPATGLNDPGIAQPVASPAATTTYTLTIDNSGCVQTDTVTVYFGGIGHSISGKTRYLPKVTAGYPAPNLPTYNSVKYNINKVIVKLKSHPGGTELARDTSDALGVYQFTNVVDGNYMLSYDKYAADTMQTGDNVNAVDVALLKYLIGHDTLIDPSKSFTAKHRKAADVDNNATINTIDVARITAKIGMPYDPVRNFPRGNWVAFDTVVAVSGADLTVTLKTVCYGDYDASSSKYKDSATTWGLAKSLPDENIILRSDESIILNSPEYFEVPLRINAKMNEFSALGLELSYPGAEYKLLSAFMPKAVNKNGAVKINPTLEEIIADNNDLLVTDKDGIIRVVFATTDHFDVAANDELVRLGFVSLNDPGRGELDFNLNGTGLIANQYGQINEDAYLTMPKIFVQGNNADAGFEFAGYPNPFNGDATLAYSIPENGTVKIKVYNAIGELVSILVDESQISGKHSVDYFSQNLPAGMYTFKLEFTGSGKSKCLMLKMIH